MSHQASFFPLLYGVMILLCIKPLGSYIAAIYEGHPPKITAFLLPLEHFIYRLCKITPTQEMSWKYYFCSLLGFNLLGASFVYLILRYQVYFPFNPQQFSEVPPLLALNTAISFATNTNWQAYAGEATLSYFSQMVALTVQNFLSASSGMAIAIAFIRGLRAKETRYLGNFWVDIVKGVLYILLPLSFCFSLFLVSQGVIQNLKPYQTALLLQPFEEDKSAPALSSPNQVEQLLPMGPVASQVAIKQLGSNGGGFFNTNSAHPFENPTPLSHFLEMMAILLIPTAFCYTFGVMIKDKRQGWSILLAMGLLFLPPAFLTLQQERHANPLLTPTSLETFSGNFEGKEIRFGIIPSALWAATTTATSNGAMNATHESFMPLGGGSLLWLMQLGEIAFGGVGCGLYSMLLLIVLTVFVGGLMVGRTPEYLGKKIEPFEMKMACLGVLLPPLFILIGTAIACVNPLAQTALSTQGPQGFSEILYAFTSLAHNNGSAFTGLKADNPFYHLAGSITMTACRYGVALAVLAIAGSLSRKKTLPSNPGTLATHTLLFIFLLVGIALILGALSFLPALALGPIVEHTLLEKMHGNP